MKLCPKCAESKEISEFHKNTCKKDGYNAICKRCRQLTGNPYQREYYQLNQEDVKAQKRRYRQANKQKVNHFTALRKATKLRATPSWLTTEQLNEIKQIYINCPKGMQVDHIVPLKGKEVNGLHVPWNLQYLTPKENSKKRNHLSLYLPQ